MKTGLIIVGLVILAAIGYFAFMQPAAQTTTQSPTDTASQGKLNINAICEGALAYMSFPSSVEADAFVQDCKDGKHPEVIEKYKADMNLGAGATI